MRAGPRFIPILSAARRLSQQVSRSTHSTPAIVCSALARCEARRCESASALSHCLASLTSHIFTTVRTVNFHVPLIFNSSSLAPKRLLFIYTTTLLQPSLLDVALSLHSRFLSLFTSYNTCIIYYILLQRCGNLSRVGPVSTLAPSLAVAHCALSPERHKCLSLPRPRIFPPSFFISPPPATPVAKNNLPVQTRPINAGRHAKRKLQNNLPKSNSRRHTHTNPRCTSPTHRPAPQKPEARRTRHRHAL